MGIKQGGSMVILAGAGPMGLSAIDLALHGPEHRPGRLVITDIDQARLDVRRRSFRSITPKPAALNCTM
jgi:threonine dehydrogenase-like Zn-dependent dehydrogenase